MMDKEDYDIFVCPDCGYVFSNLERSEKNPDICKDCQESYDKKTLESVEYLPEW